MGLVWRRWSSGLVGCAQRSARWISTGTVVTVFGDGAAFQVEVDGDLVRVEAGEVAAVDVTGPTIRCLRTA